jgi:hypothetical protein
MSWNLPSTTRLSSHNQSNNDRFGLVFDLIADMRRRLETSEHTVSALTTRIELLEADRNTNNLFNFEPRRPQRAYTYDWTIPIINNTNTNTRTTGAGAAAGTAGAREVADASLTPLVDNIFNDIMFDSLRRGLSIEHLNINTSTELFVGLNNNNNNQEEGEGEGMEEERDSCCICREHFENSSIIRKINSCGHKFHLSCIDTWFQTHHTCPMCRVSVRIVIPTGNTRAAETDRENNRNRGTYTV